MGWMVGLGVGVEVVLLVGLVGLEEDDDDEGACCWVFANELAVGVKYIFPFFEEIDE